MTRLLAALDLDASQAMALGDGANDVEMLRLVGLGVAMGDGHPLARAAADVVVAGHADDGVADAVERFVLRKTAVLEDFRGFLGFWMLLEGWFGW